MSCNSRISDTAFILITLAYWVHKAYSVDSTSKKDEDKKLFWLRNEKPKSL